MSRKSPWKLLRNLVLGLVALVLVGAASVYGITHYRLHRAHSIPVQSIAVPNTSDAVERGRHLVVTRGCADCHGSDLGGHKVIDDPLAGVFHGPNLTRGVGGLPADYADIDFIRSIRHGASREGRALALMPSHEYTTLSDEDLGNMIAYLKTVPAVDRPRGPVAPGPLIRTLMVLGEVKLAVEEIDHAAPRIASITPAISADYGKYLASSCIGCHGPNLSGGSIAGAPPDWPKATNLTPHDSVSFGTWTEKQFIHALRARQRPDGSTLHPVMPAAFGQMNDLELKALWAYLKTLPAFPTGAR